MPDSFETALDFLHTSLHEMHVRGVQLHAPVEVLDQLLEVSAHTPVQIGAEQDRIGGLDQRGAF